MLVAVSSLPRGLKSMTLGSILFDRTMNVQNQGAIESYPTEHVQIYCVNVMEFVGVKRASHCGIWPTREMAMSTGREIS
jgi:hypothetical protein